MAQDMVTEGQIRIFFSHINTVSLWLHPCFFWFSMSKTSENFRKSQVTDDLSERSNRSSSDRDVTGHTPFELIEMVQYTPEFRIESVLIVV